MKLFQTLLLVAACAASAASQVVNVTNTGCPNFAYPTNSGAARLGQPFSWQWLCRAPAVAYTVIGDPSGNRIPLTPPITCVAGPCNLYVAPWLTLVGTFNGSWTINIPNDRILIGRTFSVQTGCFLQAIPCLDLSGAISVAIQP